MSAARTRTVENVFACSLDGIRSAIDDVILSRSEDRPEAYILDALVHLQHALGDLERLAATLPAGVTGLVTSEGGAVLPMEGAS